MTEEKIRVGFDLLPKPIVDHLREGVSTWKLKPHVYHITEILYCLRKVWYRRMHPERSTWTMKSLWNVYRGNTFDKKWTSLFSVHQKNYTVEHDGLIITGTLDFVYDDGGGPMLYDLKMPASTFFKKRGGAGQGYRHQVQAYLALAHANGELTDIHRARVLMIAEDVVVEEVEEWEGMLDTYLWPRVELLDAALSAGSPAGLSGPEENWECDTRFCPADQFFRELCV